MDVAGLVFAIGSIVPVCSSGYEALTSMKNFRKDSIALFWRLKIEEYRFICWAQANGFDTKPSGSQPTTVSSPQATSLATLRLVHGILSAVEALFLDADTMVTRYGLKRLDIPPSLPTPMRGNSLAPKRTFSLQRVTWVLHDKKAFERLVTELRGFNDGLADTMTSLSQQSLAFGVRSGVVSVARAADDLLAIRQVSGGNDEIQQVVQFKELNLANDSDAKTTPTDLWTLEIPFFEVQLEPSIASVDAMKVSLARRNGRHILVEWKYYDASEELLFLGRSIERMQRLVRLLSATPIPRDFRTIRAEGYLHDRFSSRLGIVYPLPTEAAVPRPTVSGEVSPNKPWMTLAEAIGSNRKMPILGHRIELGLLLVKAIIQLHATGWFHKSLETRNILFFGAPDASISSSAQTPDIDIRQPHIVGFEYSRPSATSEISDGKIGLWLTCDPAYVHPAYLQILKQGSSSANPLSTHDDRARFKAEYDMFSLGCLLLEIGLWRSLSSYCKPEYLAGDPTVWAVRLVQKFVPELGPRCGLRYQNAVLDLLFRGGGFGGQDTGAPLTNFELLQLVGSIRI